MSNLWRKGHSNLSFLFILTSISLIINLFENCCFSSNKWNPVIRHCLCMWILVYTVCSSLFVRILMVNKVMRFITKTRLFKYIEKFTSKNWKLPDKYSDIFHIYAQNINCRYSLEPPRRGGSNEYSQSMFSSENKKNNVYPCKPQFFYIKVGFKRVKII